MFQFNAHVVCGRIFISGGPDLNSTEPQTQTTYLYLSIFTFEETLAINPGIVCGLQKQGKSFFSKANKLDDDDDDDDDDNDDDDDYYYYYYLHYIQG